MSWWQRMILSSAVAFFGSLVDASPAVKRVAKPIALEVFNSIRLAFAGDPDFK
jgi:hypothetical protein